jgi:FlaA1/EpsC-like NDP-sugar epimerase
MHDNNPLTITDEKMERYFMSIPEACKLLIKAAEIGQGGEIMVMDMGTKKRVIDIAHEILGKMNKPDYPIKIIGARPGETLTEALMTPEEEQKAVKQDEFYIIK